MSLDDFNTQALAEEMSQTYNVGFSVDEIEKIWKDYSRSLGAIWLIHRGLTQTKIDRVFRDYVRLSDGNIWKKI